ncbi:MAG TPA: SprT family zinc-dependent metalloprotease [Rhizomicrobium sp.]|jgi:predicted metal-dependent hydrolase|nr:SprT family zinc-dependent metalloprotease [Rhizomicrobium sp.]
MRKRVSSKRPAAQLAKRELLRIDGKPVAVTLKLNPRARRLIVKVHPSTGEVTIVAPSKRSIDHAIDFARGETDWIAERLRKVPPTVPLGLGARILYRGEEHVIRRGDGRRTPAWLDHEDGNRIIRVTGQSEHAARRVLDFLKREARKILEARSFEFAARLGTAPKHLTVRDTASRWGSCSTQRSLSFSWRLILAPPFVLDYVVAHEVAHMREMNHGPRFWRLVEELVGNTEKPQAWLRENGSLLHRYAPRSTPERAAA